MVRLEKVVPALTAAAVVVPARVPLEGLVPIATVMLVVAVVTVLPWASWTATCTAGVLATPATALLGCTMNASFAAGGGGGGGGGGTGPELLPAHPASAILQSTTPAKNLPRTRAIGRACVTGHNRGNQSSARTRTAPFWYSNDGGGIVGTDQQAAYPFRGRTCATLGRR